MLAGFLLYPRVTQLDFTGPLEVLSRISGIEPTIIAPSMELVTAEKGLLIVPHSDISTVGRLNILVVPGGPGVDDAMSDLAILDFVRGQAEKAQWVLGVCTGTLLLGAAGFLQGRRSTGHWQSRELLSHFGAEVCSERTVVDGNLVTSAGVTAGIDAALKLASLVAGEEIAKQIELQIEYMPDPPFGCGDPKTADAEILASVLAHTAERRRRRERAVLQAATALHGARTNVVE